MITLHTKIEDYIKEAYSRYDKNDEILPSEIINKIKLKLGIKRFTRLGSGYFGTAFKISNTKVLKITKDAKEYEYAKKIEGIHNKHIADVYKTYYLMYDNEKYGIIIKEFCKTDEAYFDNIIDKFVKYTKGDMSLSYISSEYLFGDISKETLNSYFKQYKDNKGPNEYFMNQWYDMIMELKKIKIYVKDFNGSNIGLKPSGEICMIELGLGNYNKVKFKSDDELILSENISNNIKTNLIDFLLDKKILSTKSAIKNFLFHGTSVKPSEFILTDDYDYESNPNGNVFHTDIPEGVVFLTDDFHEAKTYGQYVIPCEIDVKSKDILTYKIDGNNPSIVFDDDFCGYGNLGMYSKFVENGYEVLEVRGKNKSTFITYPELVIPRIDLAKEFYKI